MMSIPYAQVLFAAFFLSVRAQTSTSNTITSAPKATHSLGNAPLPLTRYTFTYPDLPEQVNPFPVGRGPQSGYNICNSTTEGPNSLCQTMFVNNIEDFCIWGSPTAHGSIGDVEAIVVAYCTKPGYGTRLIPPGALTAVQFIKTPGYIQVTGLLNQTGIDLTPTDAGGELDPHGADLAGNPLGGLVFSNNLPSSTDNTTYTQVNNWSNFVGSNTFCMKACDPTITDPDYCQNIFDTQGCMFNMPASYAPNEFTSCLGDNQNPPGGNPVIPATSECTTYTSSLLYNTATSTAASTTSTIGGQSTSTSHPSGSNASSGSVGRLAIIQFVPAVFIAAAVNVAVAVFAGAAVSL